ncbi:12060_t:CDS:2, partial [Acaulospora colombiana]
MDNRSQQSQVEQTKDTDPRNRVQQITRKLGKTYREDRHFVKNDGCHIPRHPKQIFVADIVDGLSGKSRS